MALKNCVLLLLLSIHTTWTVDLTVEEGAVGTQVVLATIAKLEAAQVFSSDKRLLRRIAYVETADGEETASSSGNGEDELLPFGDGAASRRATRQSATTGNGGIWSVNSLDFHRTKLEESLANKRGEIAAAFPEIADWELVEWEDLNKPLWSALAARLVILLAENITDIPTSSDIHGQAVFWKIYYNTDGDISEFESEVATLTDAERCRVKSDIIFILDSSGSVRRRNFRRVQDFVSTFVNDLDISSNQTQVGVIVFNDIAHVVFNLSTYTDKVQLQQGITAIPYIRGYTNTADGLCLLLEDGYTEENGARLSSDDVFRIAVVITDGQSNRNSSRCDNSTTFEAAEAVHNFSYPILVFVVGVTNEVNDEELIAIATKEDYITHLNDFSQSAFEGASDEQLYELCTKSTIPREVGSQQNGSLEQGGQIRYEFQVPTEGLELILCVSQGEIELYGSFTVSNPNAALHDYMYAVNSSDTVTCVDVVIEPPQTPGHNTINGSSASLDLDTIFISLEGIEEQNDFTIVTAEVTPEEGKPEITIPREEKDCFGQSCTVVIVVVVVILIVVLALLAACALCLALFIRKKKRRWRRRKRNRVGVAVESDEHELIEADPETHMFTTKQTYSVQ